MEKFNNPYIDKLVGLPTEHEGLAQDWHNYIIENIHHIGGKNIENFEIEKTPEDKEIIKFTDTAVDELLKKYDRSKQISAPLENIHLLRMGGTEEYTDHKLVDGAHATSLRSIVIDRNPSNIQFSLVLFHELLHLKSFSALQIVPEDRERIPERIDIYRSGIAVFSQDGKTKYLENLEEAIVGYLTTTYYQELLKDGSKFQDEIEKIKSGELKINISRGSEQKELFALIDQIFEKNKGVFADKEEILNLFIDAQVNGNLMKVGRIIEKTFGVGSLKEIDQIDL